MCTIYLYVLCKVQVETRNSVQNFDATALPTQPIGIKIFKRKRKTSMTSQWTSQYIPVPYQVRVNFNAQSEQESQSSDGAHSQGTHNTKHQH